MRSRVAPSQAECLPPGARSDWRRDRRCDQSMTRGHNLIDAFGLRTALTLPLPPPPHDRIAFRWARSWRVQRRSRDRTAHPVALALCQPSFVVTATSRTQPGRWRSSQSPLSSPRPGEPQGNSFRGMTDASDPRERMPEVRMYAVLNGTPNTLRLYGDGWVCQTVQLTKVACVTVLGDF